VIAIIFEDFNMLHKVRQSLLRNLAICAQQVLTVALTQKHALTALQSYIKAIRSLVGAVTCRKAVLGY
jgi:hypothetical protein